MEKKIIVTLLDGTEFEVVYVRLDESKETEDEIYVNSYANKNSNSKYLFL